MPVDWKRYPADWPEIRERILAREGYRCKWCGAADRVYGYRDETGAFHEVPLEMLDGLALDGVRTTFIVLTVAHLGEPKPDGSPGDKHDKLDVRDENLAALCQRCHLLFDLPDHVRHAAETRRRKRIEAGQMELL